MRLFQNSGIAPSYRPRLAGLVAGIGEFEQQKEAFLNDRYGAAHILLPVLDRRPEAFFTNGDDESLQRAWARKNGMAEDSPLADILLAQIEHHRTDIFYNLDPFRYDAAFVHRLPGHVKRKIAWRAAPGRIDFSGYDLVTCNFPSMRQLWEEQGAKTAHFFPAHDPELDAVAANRDRDIDVLFFGGYSRHHQRRRQILESVARLSSRRRVVFHLDLSRYTPLAETPLGWFGPLNAVRRPRTIRKVSAPPVFGRAMYAQLGRAKIVVNASIDMAGPDRGNMRCFETMGAGALLVSDSGIYPAPMRDGETMAVYEQPQ
ncbi:MAG: glycosyltransferase family 1 protein, partial [Mesorhizobium sp.]